MDSHSGKMANGKWLWMIRRIRDCFHEIHWIFQGYVSCCSAVASPMGVITRKCIGIMGFRAFLLCVVFESIIKMYSQLCNKKALKKIITCWKCKLYKARHILGSFSFSVPVWLQIIFFFENKESGVWIEISTGWKMHDRCVAGHFPFSHGIQKYEFLLLLMLCVCRLYVCLCNVV